MSAHIERVAGYALRLRPFGLIGSSAMNSAQENSACCGSGGLVVVVAVAAPIDRDWRVVVAIPVCGHVPVDRCQLDRRPDANDVVTAIPIRLPIQRQRTTASTRRQRQALGMHFSLARTYYLHHIPSVSTRRIRASRSTLVRQYT